MSENSDKINLRNGNVINYKKCGEILIAPNQFQFVCKLCPRFFTQANDFMRHILNGSHAEELDIPLPQSTVDIYSVEELIGEGAQTSKCLQSVEMKLRDADVEYEDEIEILYEDDTGDAQSAEEYQLIEIDELPLSPHECSAGTAEQQHKQSFDDRESGCCSFESISTQQITPTHFERQDFGNNSFINLDSSVMGLDVAPTIGVETLPPTFNTDNGYDSLKSVTDSFVGHINDSNDSLIKELGHLYEAEERKSMEAQRQAKKFIEKSEKSGASTSKSNKKGSITEFDKDADENKENTPPKWPIEAYTMVPLNAVELRSKSQRVPDKTTAKNDRPRLIRMLAPLRKRTDDQQIAMSSNAGPVKRKSDIGVEECTQGEIIGSKRLCDGIATTLSTETPVNGKQENLNDQTSNEMLQRGEVLARMRHIKKQILQAIQPNKRACGTIVTKELQNIDAKENSRRESLNVQITDAQALPNLNINRTTDTIKSFCLQTSQMIASTPALEFAQPSKYLKSYDLSAEQSTLDLTSDTVNMDSIQLDEHKLASDSNMEGISLLDASAISLPEQVDLDGSLAAPSTSQMQNISSSSTTDVHDVELLAKVGLHCIRMSTLENTLTLAEEEVIHARARIFAETLRQYESIWCPTTTKGNIEADFSALAARLNECLNINSNTNELKQIVNELFVWYKIVNQQKLIKKRRPPKLVHFYLQIFAFLPKTARYTIYCEHCPAKFHHRRDYRQHKQGEHDPQQYSSGDRGNMVPLTPARPERGNICAVCDVICATAEQLYEHSKTHLEQVHECTLCARVFATANDLQSHTQICHHHQPHHHEHHR